MRHAKSSWDDPALDDFDRPLAPRGRKAARRMGGYIEREGLAPDLVVCSAARRAHETWRLARGEIDGDIRSSVTRSLYLASPDRLLRAVRRAPDSAGRLLVIAHNPGIQELAVRLDADADDGRGSGPSAGMRAKFPTAALAVLSVDARSWFETAGGRARLVKFVRPRRAR